jgi:hypothetical protein
VLFNDSTGRKETTAQQFNNINYLVIFMRKILVFVLAIISLNAEFEIFSLA